MVLPTQKMQLVIEHVPTNKKVSFPAYIEMFSDQYSSNWNAEDVYGRMDPIATFINTRRSLSLAWNVPAASFDDAKANLEKVNKLMSFLYPLYDQEPGNGDAPGATAINQSPLIRISFGNLVRDAKTGRGLLGYANGFTFDPAVEFGMFHNQPKALKGTKNVPVEYYPKTFRLNTELNVLHEHSLGFKRTAGGKGQTFSFTDKALDETNYPYATSLAPKGKEALAIHKAAIQAARQSASVNEQTTRPTDPIGDAQNPLGGNK
ncbi:MAG: hypothetical protein ACXADL_13800 [Candidatus Thorarchaeota archaeon]|jgi:hypothetical protein